MGAGKEGAVGMQRNCINAVAVTLKRVGRLACDRVPKTGGVVIATTGKEIAVGIKLDAPDPVGMFTKDLGASASAGIPKANGLVVATAGKGARWG